MLFSLLLIFCSTTASKLALALGGFGLLVAGVLIFQIKNAPAGNARMAEVAGAIQEGAAAYLKRQLVAVGIIAVIITVLLAAWKQSMAVPAGFVIGAVCSLAAGYIGMRIAVLANVRTTQAATESEPQGPAGRLQWRGGDRFAGGRAGAAQRGDFLSLYARHDSIEHAVRQPGRPGARAPV